MSDSDTENKVLGKRSRNGQEGEGAADPAEQAKMEVEEDSDDDVGPMPMPAGPGNGVAKKKRKGPSRLCHIIVALFTSTSSAAP